MKDTNRRGFAMPAVIGALVIIGIMVTAGFYMARQELRIGVASNYANMAVNVAQAGANEVMANWNGYQLGNIAPWASTTITGTAKGGNWSVNIHNANNFVYFLTATGTVTEGGAMWAGATRTVGITTKILFADIDPPAALTTRGQVTMSGNSTISGNNVTPPTFAPYCTGLSNANMPGVMLDDVTGTPSTKGSNPYAGGSSTLIGNPPAAEDPTMVDSTFTNFGDMTFSELVTFAQIEGKDVTSVGSFNGISPSVTGSPAQCNTAVLLNWGDPDNPTAPCGAYFPLIYRNGAMTIQSNSVGQGILLVEGNLEMRGGFRFYGIVIVQGTFTTGNGGATIYGAVLASNAADLQQTFTGGGQIIYSRCAVTRSVLNNASLSRARPLEMRSWVDLSASAN
jgi:hypothetical protein